jgi:hypothetical protein
MTQTELLYSFYGAATTTTPTAGAVSMTATYPAIVIPAGIFANVGNRTTSLRLKLGGTIIATATVPTFQFGLAMTTATPPTFATTFNLGATTATAPSTTAGSQFFIEADIGIRTLSIGTASTVVTALEVRSPAFTYPYAGGAVVTTYANYETDLQYFLWPYLTLGAATAGNTVTVNYCKLYGEN